MRAPWHYRLRAWLARAVSPQANFDAASMGSRTRHMQGPRGPVDDLSHRSVSIMRARSRHMIRNQPAARRAAAVLATQVVGTGITPSSPHADLEEYLKLVRDHQRQVGVVQGQSLASVQRLAFRTVFSDGAALVLRQRRTLQQMRDRDLVTPWQLEVLSPDQLATERDDGLRIRGGIETDDTGWIVAYHLYRTHPDARHAWDRDIVRISAADVAYLWVDDEPGQLVGLPWLQAVMLRLEDWDQLSHAQVVKQKVAAMWAGFIKRAFGGGTIDATANPEIDLEPGRMQYLQPGEEVEFGQPPSADGYIEVATVQGREVSSGVGVTYEDLTGDYSQVNYSSARMGALVSRAIVNQHQLELMVGRLCGPLGRWLIEAAEGFGYDVPVADEGDRSPALRWTPPPRDLIDPEREIMAINDAIVVGVTSRQEEIRKLGRDPAEVDRERAQDAEREASLGLVKTEGDGATGEDLQTTALNGAQVTSMVEVLTAVASGMLPAESAIRILMRAFQLPREDAEAMVNPAESFEQETQEEAA